MVLFTNYKLTILAIAALISFIIIAYYKSPIL